MENENFAVDKRRYPRVDFTLPVQYKNLRKSTVPPAGSITRNISEGGVCFKSSEFISLACRLVVEINLPNISRPIKAISKVAWIRRVPASEQYELGNQFLEMTKEDKAHITEFITKTSKSGL